MNRLLTRFCACATALYVPFAVSAQEDGAEGASGAADNVEQTLIKAA